MGLSERIVYTLYVQKGGQVSTPIVHVCKNHIFKEAKMYKVIHGKNTAISIRWMANGKERIALIRSSGDWEMISPVG